MCQKLSEDNWDVVLCSARPIQSLALLADKLYNIDWVCGLGGAVIANRKQSSKADDLSEWRICHHAQFINDCAIHSIFSWAIKNNFINIWAYDSDYWFVTKNTERTDRESIITGLIPEVCTVDKIEKKSLLKLVFPHVPEYMFDSLKKCTEDNGLVANYSTDTQVEINTPILYDKGISNLKKLISNDSDITIHSLGDGANDFGMLSSSDISYTFSDAHPSLLTIAKNILNENRENAYKEIIGYLF